MTDYDAKVATGGSRAWLRILLQTSTLDQANNRVYARLAYEIDANGSQTANSGYTSYWSFDSSLTGAKSGTFTYNLANGYVLLYDTGYQWWNCAADGTFRVTANGSITPDSPLTYASVSFDVTPVDWPRPPGQPGAPTLTRTSNGASIGITSQTPSSPVAIDAYQYAYSTDNSNWSGALSMSGNTATLSVTATQGYYIITQAHSSEGWGAWSPSSYIAGIPSAPSSITATRSARNVTVTISGSSTNGGATITSYMVQSSADGGATWTTAQNISSGTYTYSNLAPAITYLFRAYATNSTGNSAYANSYGVFVPAGGKRYDGTAWQSMTTAKRFDGTAWNDIATSARFDGTNWVYLS